MKKLLRFDWASKYHLQHKSHYGILEGFLSELLLQNIKIKNIIPKVALSKLGTSPSEMQSTKTEYLVENSKQELIIQIQNNRDTNYYQRMVYGSAKTLVDNFQGYESNRVRKFICINIVYASVGQIEDYVYRGKIGFDGLHQAPLIPKHGTIHNGSYFKNEFKDLFPEYYIIYVYNFKDVVKNALDEWMYYLKYAEIKDSFIANGIKEAKTKLVIDRLSPEERKEYEGFLNLINNDPLDILQMRLKTESLLKEKELTTKVDIARALKGQYVPIEIISTSTGLPIDKIQSL